jgi:hypothetical protein
MPRLVAWLLVPVLALGCGCARREIPSGPDADTHTDPDVDAVDSPDDILDPDVWVDPPLDDGGEDDPGDDEALEPSCPPDGPVGTACAADGDCSTGYNCLVERSQTWGGEEYVAWPGGYCVEESWSSGCDPDDPSACPEGARCVHLVAAWCEDRWACMDACSPADALGVPFSWNACCRPGYRCDPALRVCLPGCSNDRECCERWNDDDGDTLRSAPEVSLDGDCTRSCDGSTFACAGPGDGGWASACTFDSDCPDDATCLDASCVSGYGGPFPGGLCILERCDLVGIDCTAGAGCLELGTRDPVDVCIAACTSGLAPGDPSSPCRDTYACVPACGGWVEAPAGGEDGACLPANPSTAAADTLYEACTDDSDCHSPLGLGMCLETAGLSRCSVHCNAQLARSHDVCGAPGSPGGLPVGACWQCRCLRVCDDPSAPLSADGCAASGALACYSTASLFGEITYTTGAASPPGLCLPACATSGDCMALWGMPLACDTATGTCL